MKPLNKQRYPVELRKMCFFQMTGTSAWAICTTLITTNRLPTTHVISHFIFPCVSRLVTLICPTTLNWILSRIQTTKWQECVAARIPYAWQHGSSLWYHPESVKRGCGWISATSVFHISGILFSQTVILRIILCSLSETSRPRCWPRNVRISFRNIVKSICNCPNPCPWRERSWGRVSWTICYRLPIIYLESFWSTLIFGCGSVLYIFLPIKWGCINVCPCLPKKSW